MDGSDNTPPHLPIRSGTILRYLTQEQRDTRYAAIRRQEQRYVDWVRAHPTPRLQWLRAARNVEAMWARERAAADPTTPLGAGIQALLAGDVCTIVKVPSPPGCSGHCNGCIPPRDRNCAEDPERRSFWLYHKHPWWKVGLCPQCGRAAHWWDVTKDEDMGLIDYADSLRRCEDCGHVATTTAWVMTEMFRGWGSGEGARRPQPAEVLAFPRRSD
jgi:hypothetical protein